MLKRFYRLTINMITKETAYKYLKYKGTMDRYTKCFHVVDIYKEQDSGINEHPVIKCEYQENNKIKHKNVHIDLLKFGDWIKKNRQNIIDELIDTKFD